MNEKDYRHLKLMSTNVKLYKNEQITLFELIKNLDTLINNLEQIKEEQKNNLRGYCGVLEEVYAVKLQDDTSIELTPDIQDKKIIAETLKKMEKIINEILDDFKKSDPLIKEKAEIIDQEWLLCPVCHDAWLSNSLDAMVVCTNCQKIMHNPRF
ncbi:MAG: hypothetical protein WC371_03180 [Parachlamydiales bacterium]|jgi:uncharacterized CHY-type Zn-finger protein